MHIRSLAATLLLFAATLLTSVAPAQATTITGTAQIATGAQHSCVLATTGAAYCWGRNFAGQLGDGSMTDSLIPVAVSGGHTFTKLGNSVHTSCGIDGSGTAWCWGQDSWGSLGNGGATGNSSTPVAVNGGHNFTWIGGGESQTCGLDNAGAAWCWGTGYYGSLGTGNTADVSVPTAVVGGHTFIVLSTKYEHTCAIDTNNDAWCWGQNSDGQLGDGGTTQQNSPVAVTGSHKFASISVGDNFTCGVSISGAGYCWGWGGQNQMGHNGASPSANTSPLLVDGGHTWSTINSGSMGSCGIDTGGTAYCWGSDGNGQLASGGPGSTATPTAVSFGYNWTAIAMSMSQGGCGTTSGGGVYCWGMNDYGQRGDNSTTTHNVPTATYLSVELNNTTISAVVDPSFTFTVAGRATVCNGQAGTNFQTGASGTAVSLGHIGPATVGGAAQDLSVATNAGNGFTAYIRTSGTTPNALRSGGNSIADVSGTHGSPGAAPVAGTAGFGYTSSDVFASNAFAKLTNSNDSVLVGSAGTATKSTCVGYEVAASPSTPAAAYAITIIYTAVPTF